LPVNEPIDVSLIAFSAILNAAKDPMPVATGDEVLRYAQDDKKF